jgi:NAD+ kinase
VKFGIYVHPQRPKIQKKTIKNILESLNLKVSETSPDMALVIGGDGTFSYYGRNLSIPMLFVGVPNSDILGSKSRLAETSLENIAKSLQHIKNGMYCINKRKMLDVRIGVLGPFTVLTDIYVERGIFAGCIRYTNKVTENKAIDVCVNGKSDNGIKQGFTEYVIGNGIIVSTSFGSTGYYSYIDKLKDIDKETQELFDDEKIGVCHILPTFAVIKKDDSEKAEKILSVRYTIPFQSTIKINIIRKANVRLYGTTSNAKGVSVQMNNPITISPSERTAEIIRLPH